MYREKSAGQLPGGLASAHCGIRDRGLFPSPGSSWSLDIPTPCKARTCERKKKLVSDFENANHKCNPTRPRMKQSPCSCRVWFLCVGPEVSMARVRPRLLLGITPMPARSSTSGSRIERHRRPCAPRRLNLPLASVFERFERQFTTIVL